MAVSMDLERIVAGGQIVKKTIGQTVKTRAKVPFPIIESTYSPSRSGISAILQWECLDRALSAMQSG